MTADALDFGMGHGLHTGKYYTIWMAQWTLGHALHLEQPHVRRATLALARGLEVYHLGVMGDPRAPMFSCPSKVVEGLLKHCCKTTLANQDALPFSHNVSPVPTQSST